MFEVANEHGRSKYGKAVCARAVFEAIQRDARATADRNIAKLTGDAKMNVKNINIKDIRPLSQKN